jgi:hypothetical protein
MGRETLIELRIKLGLVAPKVGTLWKHKSGTIYRITGVSIRESDGEVLFTYTPFADFGVPTIFFTRPASEWEVPAEGDIEPRFKQVFDF